MALIIDAEMPHSCFDCPCLYREVDGRYFCRHSDGLLYPLYYPMTDGCPILGEIPDKHGRLIDANVAYDKIAEHEGGNYVDMDAVDLGLQETPTILEATNG